MPRLPLAPALAAILLAPALAGCVSPTATEPSKVADLRVEQVPDGLRLSWGEFPAGVAVSYKVYKDGKKVAETPLRTWLDRDAKPDVTYRYTVSTVNAQGREGPKHEDREGRFVRSLALLQDERVNRGFTNLTVVQASPGLRWGDLRVLVNGESLTRDETGYTFAREAWTHSSSRDPLVDLGEKLKVYAPGKAVRNATFEVRLVDGAVLAKDYLKGRPTVNLTLRQERNATQGQVSLEVLKTRWTEGTRDVSKSHPQLVPRWSALEVRVNGTHVPYYPDHRPGSWSHEVPADDVVRAGGRLTIRHPLIGNGAEVVVLDAEMADESFRVVLK